MTLLLSHEEVRGVVSMEDAIVAMEGVFREEGEGNTVLPARINMAAGRGWLRVGPATLAQSGWTGFKAMNLAAGRGVRYQLHLYAVDTGALLSIMDAQFLTTLRTGATSAVATRRLARPGPASVAVLGSGAEAHAQLEAMHVAGYVGEARVYSPTPANRDALAAEFRDRFGLTIAAVDSAARAVAGADLIVAAVKSAEAVLLGEWLRPGMHVNSVGSVRRDQREIDIEVFRRSGRIVVDTLEGVFGEAGDAFAARGAVEGEQLAELAALVTGRASGRQGADEITLFKSVGTGLQDIALAAVIYERALAQGVGTDLGDFPYLKRR